VKLRIEWRDENHLDFINIVISDANDRKFSQNIQKYLPDHHQERPNGNNGNFTLED
jgi:hypothetical protein